MRRRREKTLRILLAPVYLKIFNFRPLNYIIAPRYYSQDPLVQSGEVDFLLTSIDCCSHKVFFSLSLSRRENKPNVNDTCTTVTNSSVHLARESASLRTRKTLQGRNKEGVVTMLSL